MDRPTTTSSPSKPTVPSKTATSFDYETNASSYSIRVQAKDEHNASIEKEFTLTLNDLDDTAPVITLLGDSNITHEAGPEYVDAGAKWNDSVDGNGTADANGTVNSQVPGIYLITYTYTDSSGNPAVPVTRTIEVGRHHPTGDHSDRRRKCHPSRIDHLTLIREHSGTILSMATVLRMPMVP